MSWPSLTHDIAPATSACGCSARQMSGETARQTMRMSITRSPEAAPKEWDGMRTEASMRWYRSSRLSLLRDPDAAQWPLDYGSNVIAGEGVDEIRSGGASFLHRKRKFEYRPTRHVGACPQPSAMRLDDRAVDRHAHPRPRRLDGMEGLEETVDGPRDRHPWPNPVLPHRC